MTEHPRRVRAYAHRGGALHPDLIGMENTLEAFRHAVSLGYTHLETDVHVTRDGVLLAFHDEALDRVTDVRGLIAEMTYAEVQSARIGGLHGVPTLAELFEAFPEATFNIDLKSDGAGAALAALLVATDREDKVIVGSFSGRRLEAFRRLTQGRVRTSAHPREVLAYLLSPTAGIARRLAGERFDAFQIPHRQRLRGPLSVRVASRGLVRRAHQAGKEVHVWTIDDPAEMEQLVERDVDGLMTDRTDLLKAFLVERGLWESDDERGEEPAK
ncbi:glycerophosphodiester phosphodiesterase family protein [Nocardioides albertanoniae]|uniref:glycerophosphodiester phosphodiesterase family protein n=1 Tax=Nocardioides albertanoniae TaxID=1175486 RepID=UPI001151F7AD|nr:glycerophosphodiester phosphodiesterase family protein [Nocardioides albertanoniae]